MAPDTLIPVGPELNRALADAMGWTDIRLSRHWVGRTPEGEDGCVVPEWSTDPAAAVMLEYKYKLGVRYDMDSVYVYPYRDFDGGVFADQDKRPEAVARCVLAMLTARSSAAE